MLWERNTEKWGVFLVYKLLITEGNEELRHALVKELSSSYLIKSCADGEQARELLADFSPDLWILDLMLPMVDGVTLLRQAHSADLHPVTLVTLSYSSEYILGALQKYAVAYAVSKPCSAHAVACQVHELAATIVSSPQPSEDSGINLSSVLLELGISPKVDGFSYLLTAIPLYVADPRQGLTKELYSAVGHSFGKNGLQVERCIRTAVQSAWVRGDMRVWQRFFPSAPDGSVPRPSNGDFISHIAAYMSVQKLSRGA